MNLIGSVKTYQWGKLGSSSKVAELAKLNCPDFNIDPNESYSELWMGDHISGLSIIADTKQSLSDFISNDKSLIGNMDKLPFLLKVLSIGKALSVQVHPNKQEAEHLFATRPDLYKDSNHKPELAIALTPFTALCGFRPFDEIYSLLKQHKPLEELIGIANIENLKSNETNGLKDCFSRLMHSSDENISKCIKELSETLNEKNNEIIFKHFHTLNNDFPNDVGILCLFFLNIIDLQPGQAIFLAAKVPHAYLSGDCIECMACSDNVIRAGLTPKFKDVDTLLTMLNYNGIPANRQIFHPIVKNKNQQVFAPNVNDFAVVKINVPKSEKQYDLENSQYGSILIVLSGKAIGKPQNLSSIYLQKGKILFLPAKLKKLLIEFEGDANDDFIAYQAMYNDFNL